MCVSSFHKKTDTQDTQDTPLRICYTVFATVLVIWCFLVIFLVISHFVIVPINLKSFTFLVISSGEPL